MLLDPVPDPTPAARTFGKRCGASVVGFAPARANLIGEHLDYNGGPSLPIALPYWTYVAARRLDRPGLVISSEGHGSVSDTQPAGAVRAPRGDWSDYPVGVVQTLRDLPGLPDGIELTIVSTVPIGSGLSSSASLSVATAAAVWALASGSTDLPRDLLLDATRSAENDFAGAPTGSLDQTSALYARPHTALAFRPDTADHDHVPWNPEEAGAGLLVVNTRVRHTLTGGGYGERVSQCRSAAGLLGVTHLAALDPGQEPWTRLREPVLAKRVRHVVTETRRTEEFARAAAAGDMVVAGRLMTASHRSLRDDYEVSCPELDLVVDTALRHGALGARMTGGGFGGCALVLIDRGSTPRVAEALLAAFASQGLAEPGLLDGTPVGPAGVIALEVRHSPNSS